MSAFGCVATASVEVKHTEPIDINFGSDTIICPGESVILSIPNVTNATTKWYRDDDLITNNEFSQTFKETGLYRLEVEDQFGCLYEDELSIEVSSIPEAALLSASNEYCDGDEASLTIETEAQVLQWQLGEEVIPTTEKTINISESGVYNAVVVNENGCLTVTTQRIEFFANPEVELGEDKLFCKGNQGAIGIENRGELYEWYLDDSKLEASTSFFTPVESGVYTLIVSNDFGCFALDDVIVDIVDGPQLLLDEKAFICPGESIDVAVESDAELFEWYRDNELVGRGESGIISLANPGIYEIKAFGETGCEVSAIIEIEQYDAPLLKVEETYSFCQGEVIEVEASTLEYNYKWYKDDSPLPDNQRILSISSSGSYSVDAINANGCITTASFIVEEKDLPYIEIGSGFDLCEGSELTLEVDSDAAEFQWNLNGNIIANASGSSFIATQSGEYSIIGIDEFGCKSVTTTQVFSRPAPSITLADSYVLCPGDQFTLDAGDHDIYSWSTGESGRMVNLEARPTDNPINETISIEVTNEFQCSSSKSINITYLPELVAEIVSDVDHICQGDNVLLTVEGGSEYKWIGLESNENTLDVSPASTSTYTVEVRDQCPSNFLILETTVEVSDGSDISISPDTCIIKGEQIQLDVRGAEFVEWQNHSSFVTDINVFNPVVSPDEDHIYDVFIVDPFGCEFDASIEICVGDIYEVLRPPNLIAPGNGDNFNEALLFQGLEQYPGAKLQVMNRWGDVVFSHSGYQSDENLFTGLTNNKKELDSGNYFYILEVPGFTQVVKSSLTIIR